MTRRRLWTLMAVIFLSGVIIGVMGSGLVVKHVVKRAIKRIVKGDNTVVTKIVMRQMRRHLGLSPEQREKIRPIVTRAIVKIRDLGRRMHPVIKKILHDAVGEVKKHLTPEQQLEFKRRLDKLKRMAPVPL